MLKPRIVKSIHCKDCRHYLKVLDEQNFDYLIYDADDEANLKQLDEWKISFMPVVQIVDVKSDGSEEFVSQLPPGQWSVRAIDGRIKKAERERKNDN